MLWIFVIPQRFKICFMITYQGALVQPFGCKKKKYNRSLFVVQKHKQKVSVQNKTKSLGTKEFLMMDL